MQLKDLKEEQKLFEVVAGSQAYGTATPESDVDIRGIFFMPEKHHLSLKQTIEQVSDNSNDITFYELRRYINLAAGCNPNIIELLWTPDDCIKLNTPVMQLMLDKRDMFISQKAVHTFSGYAYSQIKRAKGQNKWVNNPKSEDPPSKFDFCWVIPMDGRIDQESELTTFRQCDMPTEFPMRPVPLREAYKDSYFGNCVVAGLEHVENMYRLYEYSDDSRGGVLRGPNQQLVTHSIPKEDEWRYFAGFFIYNEQAYDRARRDWKNYWEWKKNRNEARYVSLERGEIDYDAKHLMHCMRLLWSGINILENGEPIVRFEGEQLEKLRDIRAGKYEYDELMQWVETENSNLKLLRETTDIPYAVDNEAIDKLYFELLGMAVDQGGNND